MGINNRRAMREIAVCIAEANQQIAGWTLGQVCAADHVVLPVSCYVCPRKGRYRVTRLIYQHGPGFTLVQLLDQLTASCPRHGNQSYFDRCGAYYPRIGESK